MIVVVSDTHSERLKDLPKTLLYAIEIADMVVHAGDFDRFSIYEELSDFELVAVAGNSDEEKIELPEITYFDYKGLRIAVKHEPLFPDGSDLVYKAKELEADLMIFGHTHHPFFKEIAGIFLLNPGSPTKAIVRTFAEIYVDNVVEIILRGVNGEVIERFEIVRG